MAQWKAVLDRLEWEHAGLRDCLERAGAANAVMAAALAS